MRSVVVVLPASMCAMIPMLRVLASGNSLKGRESAILVSSSLVGSLNCGGLPGGLLLSGDCDRRGPGPTAGLSDPVFGEAYVRWLGRAFFTVLPLAAIPPGQVAPPG